MAATTKLMGQLFPRKKYVANSTARLYSPLERAKLVRLLGQGYKLHLMTRVYDRSPTNNPSADFAVMHGCFGEELPVDSLRGFSMSAGTMTPNLPYDSTSMSALPDDGYAVYGLGMGLVDVLLKVSGTGPCWVELEVWYTVEMEA